MSEYVCCDFDLAEGIDCRELEQIVRCRDCAHYTEDEAEYYHYCGCWCEQVEPYGYCAWGERRADA